MGPITVHEDLGARRRLVVTGRLRDRRRDLGLTQKQVVTRLARLGVQTTNKALSCLEHGAGLDVAKLPDLALALDCTTTYLLGLTDDPARWEPDAAGPARPATAHPAPAHPAPRPVAHLGVVPDRPAGEAEDDGDDAARTSWILGPVVPPRRTTR